MARDDLISADGTVEKVLGGGKYQVTLETGQAVAAQLSGRMRRFRIRVIPGDRVTVGLSPYDPSHGFITFRLREGAGGDAGPGPGGGPGGGGPGGGAGKRKKRPGGR